MNPLVGVAVAAFRDRQRVALLLDKKDRELALALYRIGGQGYVEQDVADYHRLTQEILDEYEVKREKEGL